MTAWEDGYTSGKMMNSLQTEMATPLFLSFSLFHSVLHMRVCARALTCAACVRTGCVSRDREEMHRAVLVAEVGFLLSVGSISPKKKKNQDHIDSCVSL